LVESNIQFQWCSVITLAHTDIHSYKPNLMASKKRKKSGVSNSKAKWGPKK